MKIRKTMMLLCALVLVLSACSGGSGNNTNKPTNQTSNNGAANASAPPVLEEEVDESRTPEMDFDMGGRTIKVVSWWNMEITEDNPDNIQKKKNLDELMKKHNFKMEYVAIDFGEYQQKVTASLLAGEPIGDIVRLGKNYTIPTLVKQDLLWPIDEYTKNAKVFNQKATNEFMQYEGRGYGFTEGQGNLVQGIFYNRTLLNQLGMKSLQDYVEEDNWNWDTFVQVAKEANKDTNNDGKLDTWGLANSQVVEHAMYSNNAHLTKGDKQNLDDPATQETLNFLSKLATEQVYRPTEGGDWQEPGQFFRQGNTLLYAGAIYELAGFQTDMPDADIGFVPFPKGPSTTEYHSGEGAFQALTIPKAVKNPEQLLYIWEKINDIDSEYDYPDQASFESLFKNEEDINNAKTVGSGMIVFDHGTFGDNLKFWDFVGEINSGTSVSTVVEKYKSVFQAAIDAVYLK
ncbi:ABC-type glycerol-3-phosphate transport system substrate-binding protein [Paenibacillus endophyticus]|uniref:ABC-type glycerol-3-phosphate transport system substrate-binding protein n=1 Tax=Paenibacillus endophyticus TaxID=1294268 RepID=A0A7W5C3R4_9BACL|nr:extracellular solute-binding protein [Paenibacillus endophyticus]MBB3150448.1 ABC-type glycerol-3-phosphate transport system substrate-binding protein [Paenibacillus endophyticus]